MNKRFLLSILLAMCFVAGWAQTGNEKKLSVTTQMFLHELAGDITFGRDTDKERRMRLRAVDADLRKMSRDYDRLYATPDTINGQVFIAAYIRLYNNSNTSELEALGVEVQSKFGNELITANIPVDKIQEVAALSCVKHINVSPLRKPTTFKARQQTQAYDVLLNTSTAQTEGLTKAYDGTGVLLGVIDTGIDFQHIAFKDKDGNTRIKKAYVYNGSSATEYDSSTIANATTDDKTGDHGTHTSSTAGGSSVIVNGNEVTVTDDHANATYGGMAPGADLYLAGVKSLSSTYLDNAVQKIVEYADANNMPVVVSNSWGSQFGPHDGTGDVADVYSSMFGDGHPNHIALFAASNDGGKAKDGEQGGYHVSGPASKAEPFSTILRSATYINTDAGYMYQGIIANAWARTPNIGRLAINVMVLDSKTGEILFSKEMTSAGRVNDLLGLTGLSKYYKGTLNVYYDQVESDKTQVLLYSADGITSQSTSTTVRNGYDPYYLSDYTLAFQLYPIDESYSTVVDVWGGSYGFFTGGMPSSQWNPPSGYNWTAGSDDMCVSDEATMPDAISIGAYVSSKTWTDYNGTERSDEHYTNGDIAYFSSYATADESPTGLQYPWITAPGARVIAGVNHLHTASVDDYSYYGDNFNGDLVVNNANNPYAAMEGTSMATPTAAGIVALWLQAAKETGTTLTINQMKHIMKETADTDSYTTSGPNHTHFGNGKINALKGIKYILGTQTTPVIVSDASALTFEGYATLSYTKVINVSGLNLKGDINVSVDGDAAFTVDKTTITAEEGENGVVLTVTWSPTAEGNTSGTVTLTSTDATSVTITLSGTAGNSNPTIILEPTSLTFNADLGMKASQTIKVTGRFLTGPVTVQLTDANNVFKTSASALPYTLVQTESGATLTVSFTPQTVTSYDGSITLSSTGTSVVIPLTGNGTDYGKASNHYLNIAKYGTINDAGWNTTYVNKLYKYTENIAEENAWLTLPVYGAWSTVKYNDQSQKWIESSTRTSSLQLVDLPVEETTWDAASPFLGNSAYFTSVHTSGTAKNGDARAFGEEGLNTSNDAVSFYVTNIDAVKLYGTGADGISSSRPAALTIYECSVDTDGTVSSADNASYRDVSTSESIFMLSADGIDKTKVYKVVASVYRGYLYEIGFRMPLDVPKTPEVMTDLETNSVEIITAKDVANSQVITITGTNLQNGVSVTLENDNNNVFSISKQSSSNGANQMPRKNSGDSFTLTKQEVEGGIGVVVNFTSTTTGEYTANLKLETTGLSSPVNIPLTGKAMTPAFVVDPASLNFNNGTVGEASTLTFHVSAELLSGSITATLTDENSVFSLDKSSIAVDEAVAGTDVTVTFTPAAATSYAGSITLSSTNANPQTVTLSGSATAGSYSLTIGSLSMSTLYLDFPVKIPYENTDLMGIYYVKGISNNAVQLARLNNVIPAYFAVLVHGNIGTPHTFQKTSETEIPLYENLLKGVTKKTEATEIKELYQCSNILTLGKSSSFIGFYNFTGTYLNANKAFLPYGNSAGSKGLSITFSENDEYGVATDIYTFGMDDDHDAWYTLQGMKLLGKPSKGGIYLHQGKTVIIK